MSLPGWPRVRLARSIVVAVGGGALLVGAGCASGPSVAPPAPIPTSEAPGTTMPIEGTPIEVTELGDDWVLPGRDYANSRATTDSSIDTSTVGDLQPAWEVEMGGSLSTVPLIVGDTIYAQDGRGTVVAVDREGQERWRSEPFGFNIGPFGVAVADGRLFAASGSKGFVALDAATGSELWRTEIVATPTTGVDIQPTVFDGTVLVSTVPISIGGIYTPGDRGVINALDAETGAVTWTFDTVLGDDLWGHPEINSGGGAWYPPAIDPAERVVYVGVANPAPFPGTPEFPNGSSREGDNLYTNSAIALDLDTGELRWYHQVHPHDLFDRDLVHTMTVPITADRHLTVATGKGGVVVGLDPKTGDRQWATPVGRHQNDDLTELDGPTELLPGTYGGVISPPASADGTVYVAVVNAPSTLSPDETSYIGSDVGTGQGEVVALDATTGAIRWTTSVPGDPMGGATVVNDLVFTALLDGTILALDRDTGSIVWRTTAPGGINGWLSVADDLLIVPVGSAQPPRLVAYRLPR